MKNNLTLAAIQVEMANIMWATGSKPWTVANEIFWMHTARHPTVKASVSRNAREGKYLIHRK